MMVYIGLGFCEDKKPTSIVCQLYNDSLGRDPLYPSFYRLRGYGLHGRSSQLWEYLTRTLSLLAIFTRFDFIVIF
jgi:hypothetical protein